MFLVDRVGFAPQVGEHLMTPAASPARAASAEMSIGRNDNAFARAGRGLGQHPAIEVHDLRSTGP